MKFRDGMWLVAEGKRVEYAEDIYSTTDRETGKGLSLLCPTRHINSRGNTLNCSTLTVDIDAVFDGAVSVEVTHWAGARKLGPNFELFPDGCPSNNASITKGEQGTTLQSGSLCATIHPNTHAFDIRFHSADGSRELTSLLSRSVGLAYSPATSNPKQTENMRDLKHYIFTQTEIGVGESIHGLGERFGAFNKVGQSIALWNDDGGTSSDQAYKNIPFWLSSRGYGVFIDAPEKVELEIGSERCCRLQTSVEGQRLKWYIIDGPTPKEVLKKYSVLTGTSQKIPSWSFGLWLTTSFTTNYDEKTVTDFLSGMKNRSIPLEVFHLDCFWLRAFHWCDFVFSQEHFPSPSAQISRLKSSHFTNKICVWINPYLGQASPVFAYAAERGYLLRRSNGDVWQWDLWQAGMALIDFTNPEAVKWYVGCLEDLFDKGVDCIKTDFGERVPVKDVQWWDRDVHPEKMHNFYAFLYNKIVFQALQNRYGNDEAVLFARAATAGTQRFPLCWGGDCESTFSALAESIRGGLSLGLSGFSFWSCDIGGFEGSPSPSIYKRWVAFGLFCSHSRLHGSNSYRVPWLIDPEEDEAAEESCTAVLKKFVRLKRLLMPYLMAQAQDARSWGGPTSVRAMAVEFPDDPTAWFLDRQFMCGESLLIAPVLTESGDVQFYLPEGKWTNWWDGSVESGPRWKKEKHGFGTLPVYVRAGAILVLGREDEGEDEAERGFGYDFLKGGEVKVYHGSPEESRATVVDCNGEAVGVLTVGEGATLHGSEVLKGEFKVAFIPEAN